MTGRKDFYSAYLMRSRDVRISYFMLLESEIA